MLPTIALRSSGWFLVPLLLPALVGCGDAVVSGDGGVDAGDTSAPFGDTSVAVAPPEIPWLDAGTPPIAAPSFLPCPPGWREVNEIDASFCEPYADDGPAACARGEEHFPGKPGCEPVGVACPVGDFAEGLPAGTTYVQAGASVGGDGTLAAPFDDLADIPWDTLAVGDTVALAKGEYDGDLGVPPGVTVIGACAAETVITDGASSGRAPIWVRGLRGAPATVRDVTLSESARPAVLVRASESLTIEGVIIEGMRDTAVLVQNGGQATVRRVSIREPGSPVFGGLLRGVIVTRGSRVELSEVVMDGVYLAGIYAQDTASEVVAEDLVIRDSRGDPGSGSFGSAMLVQTGAVATVTRALFERNRSVSVLAAESGTRVSLDTVIVRDTLLPEFGIVQSNAVVADNGAALEVQRLFVDRHHEYGLIATHAGSVVTASDVVIRGSRASVPTRSGRSLGANFGASLTARRVQITDYDDWGVFFANEGTTAVLEDLVIRDPAGTSAGSGVAVIEGADVEATRVRIENAGVVGVHPLGAGTTLRLTDAVIRGTASRLTDGYFGDGLNVQEGAEVTASRLLMEDNRRINLGAWLEGTRLEVDDLVVRDTQPQVANDEGGEGLHVFMGAVGIVRRALIQRSFVSGIISYGGTLELSDTVVERVAIVPCDDGGLCERNQGWAHGVSALDGGQITMDAFRVEGVGVCGIFVGENSSVDLTRGSVLSAEIGACVQQDGYDIDRLTSGVRYADNSSNLETTTLPVPDPPEVPERPE